MGTDAETKAAETPPRFLYRYLDHYGLNAIYDLELKITPPNEFADPFEFTPRLSDSEGEWLAAYARYRKEGMPEISMEEFKNRGFKSKLDQDMPRRFLESVSKELGVLCFSTEADIPTQWANYADGHRGLALEIDSWAPSFKDYWLRRVRYCSQEEKTGQELFTAIEKVEKSNEVSGLMEILKMCAEEKMKKWENENECRLIATLLQMKARLVEGCVLYFFELHAAEIKRVILGALASAEFEREVRKAAARHGIAVVRATLDYGNLTVSIPEA